MHAQIVLAHPEPKSYNAHMANAARRTLERKGWTTTVSDLYGMDFDPCERAPHYRAPTDRSRFDVQAEQRWFEHGRSSIWCWIKAGLAGARATPAPRAS